MTVNGTKKIIMLTIVLGTILLVWLITYLFGPIDTYSRVYHAAESPDGAWKVTVYRKRVHPFNPFAPVDVLLKVHDADGRVAYEERLYELDMWNDLKTKYEVVFEPDAILFYHLDYYGEREGARTIKMQNLRISLYKPRHLTTHSTRADGA